MTSTSHSENIQAFLKEYEELATRHGVQIMPCPCAPPVLDYCQTMHERKVLKHIISYLAESELPDPAELLKKALFY